MIYEQLQYPVYNFFVVVTFSGHWGTKYAPYDIRKVQLTPFLFVNPLWANAHISLIFYVRRICMSFKCDQNVQRSYTLIYLQTSYALNK